MREISAGTGQIEWVRQWTDVVRLELLGPLRVVDHEGHDLPAGGPKPRAVLAALALAAGHVVSRETIIEFVWDDAPPPSATTALQTYVASLRKVFRTVSDSEVLRTVNGGYVLDPEVIEIDLVRFRILVNDGRNAAQGERAWHFLRDAIRLRNGPVLGNLDSRVQSHPKVVGIEQEYLAALVECAEAQLRAGAVTDLMTWLPAAAAANPLHEPLQARLVRGYHASGRDAEALRAYEGIRRRLRDELGTGCGRELTDAYASVLAQEPTGRRVTPAADEHRAWQGRRPDSRPLVGRGAELSRLGDAVVDNPVLTLVGTGGVGKTALALAAAERVVPAFPDGVLVLECAQIGTETAGPSPSNPVADLLSDTLGGDHLPRESSLDTVARVLANQQLLVVIDNVEHVHNAAAEVADRLSRACRGVRMVLTSRHQLELANELVVEVAPLDVPDDASATEAQCTASAAVQLFVRRARQVRMEALASAQATAIVAGLCRQLGGLPLAIELAAARLRAMSLTDLAAQLDRSQAILNVARGHRPPHQRTLEATIDWSERLLGEHERLLLHRLAVFPASFDLVAVEGTCVREPLGQRDVAGLLSELVDHSMLQVWEQDGRTVYRLLVPVRRHLIECADPAQLEADRLAHLHWCAGLVKMLRHAGPEDTGHHAAMVRVRAADLHAAVEFALGTRDTALVEMAIDILLDSRAAMEQARGELSVVRGLTESALRLSGVLGDDRRSQLLLWAGRLHYLWGRPAVAQRHLREARSLLLRSVDAPPEQVLDAGIGLVATGEHLAQPTSLTTITELVRTAESTGDTGLLAVTLADLSNHLATWGHHESAAAFLDRAEALQPITEEVAYRIRYRRVNLALWSGDATSALKHAVPLLERPGPFRPGGLLETQIYCGWAYARLGELDQARQLLTYALRASAMTDRMLYRCFALLALADLERLANRGREARDWLHECLTTSLAVSDLVTAIQASWLAGLLCAADSTSTSLYALSLSSRAVTSLPAWPLTEQTFDIWAKAEAGSPSTQAGSSDEVGPDAVITRTAETALALLRQADG